MSEEVKEQVEEQPKEQELTPAEKTAKIKAERAEYKKYIDELEANVRRMRLEVEEMDLFLKADRLKKELNALRMKNMEEQAQRAKDAEEAAEKAKKEIIPVKIGEARKDEKKEAKMEIVGADKKG